MFLGFLLYPFGIVGIACGLSFSCHTCLWLLGLGLLITPWVFLMLLRAPGLLFLVVVLLIYQARAYVLLLLSTTLFYVCH